MKVGDTVFVRSFHHRRQDPIPATVAKVGRAWITVGAERYAVEASADGSHYGQFGWRLWPDLATLARAEWCEMNRRAISDAASRCVNAEALAACAKALGVTIEGEFPAGASHDHL